MNIKPHRIKSGYCFQLAFIFQILLLFGNSFGQDYIFQRLKIENGLSQSTVLSSLQDNEGYMWFATRSGLNRYDGYRFLVYSNDPKDPTSISDDAINSIFEDRDGTIWAGTVNGNLNKFNRLTETFTYKNISDFLDKTPEQTDEFYAYPLNFSRNQNISITTITEDASGNLWIGTWGNGVVVLDKHFKKIHHYYVNQSHPNGLTTNRIMSLLFDRSNNLWVATFGGGLFKVSAERIYHKSAIWFQNLTVSDSKLTALFLDSGNNLWITSYFGGVNFIESSQLESSSTNIFISSRIFTNKSNNTVINSIMSVAEDRDNFLWFGTLGEGLIRYDPKSKTMIIFTNDPLNENSLSNNNIISLSVDRSGIIWAGSHLGAGITKIQPNKTSFHLIRHIPGNINSLNDNVVWSIYKDKDNVLWIGTYKGGLNVYNPKTNKFNFIQHSNNKKSLSSNHIRSIKEDRFGNLWIGTYDEGLNILNKKTGELKILKRNKLDLSFIGGNQIQDIFIEDNNTYWLAVFGGGLNKATILGNPLKEKIKFTVYKSIENDNSSISDNRVYKIFKANNGIFWIGTFGGGLNSFNPVAGKFKRYYPDSQTVDIKNLMTIMEDSNGLMWLGSYGGGLTSFDRKSQTFTRYSVKEGLTSSVVYGILEDNKKNIWISSDNGLFRMNINTKEIKRFDLKDGLQSLEFSGGAYLKDGKELYFGGVNGLNYFNPNEIKINTYIPPVVITSIKILNERYKGEPKEITLDYKKNFISFEFSALDFNDPYENEYSYKLEGLQEDWQQIDASVRMASYTNLSPGTYIFKVKGSNSDGVWNEKYASVKIVILSPFWKEWWFISGMVLLIALFIYYLSTLRIKNLLAIEKLKSKLAADLHDNVGSGLTEISILSEVTARKINNNENKYLPELQKISELSRQLIDNMSDIVWVVNPNRDSLYDLIIRLKDTYSEILNSLGISLKTSNVDKLADIKLSMEFKQNLYLIFKEAINNAIKHSNCTRITIDANIRNDVIEISINDNGNGFDEKSIRQGNGIKNIQNRAEQIKGKIKIRSAIGSGTNITFIGRLNSFNKLKIFLNK